jgi:predicted GNAT superfamily acetyltransferase
MHLRDATPSDFAHILRLNEESVHFLSPLDAQRLVHLNAQAAYHRVVEKEGRVVAFLLAFREGCDYDSPNYQWFARQYGEFLYIDRVVVTREAQGQRLGNRLYDDLFAFAKATRVQRITCEFDVDPPNEVSRRLHERYGFREVGSQSVAGGKKRVSLQATETFPASLSIRRFQPDDWPHVWPMLQATIASGDTLAFAADTSESEMRKTWIDLPFATSVACERETILGTYFIKANQPGLGSHVCNAGYVTSPQARGKGVASAMCRHSQDEARAHGFRAMQFNIVVATNVGAVRLWQRLGFGIVGTLPGAFRHASLGYVDAYVMFKDLAR